jgi:ClpP class serine protease
MQKIDLAILRDEWMVDSSFIDTAQSFLNQYLAGKEISVGLFSKLSIPDVPEHIALIPVNGVMTKADICGGYGTRTLSNMVADASNNPAIKGIILFYESVPGGQVDGTEEFANSIAKATSIKPTIGVYSGMCCSAGVWTITQNKEVYALSKTSLFGCFGTMAKVLKKDPDAEKYEIIVSDLSPLKNIESTDQQAYKDNFLNPAAQIFKDAVQAGRNGKMSSESEKEVFSGISMVSTKAKATGAIDGIMSFDQVLKRMEYLIKKQPQIKAMANNNTAQQEGNFVFQNVLQAAKADAAIPVEEGFALSEDQLNNVDAHIAAQAQSIESLQAQLNDANASLRSANESEVIAQTQIAALTQEVTDLKAGAAVTPPDPNVAADPLSTDKSKFMTSADIKKSEQAKKFGA